MVRGNQKSRTFRRIMKRTPGAKTVLRYARRKPSKSTCGKCGLVLQGVARKLPRELSRVSKTERRPQRMFGGVLCTKCSKREIIRRSRSI